VRAVVRACALGCLVAVVVAGRPAAAAMTLVYRYTGGNADGKTYTFYQDGDRVRVPNPSGDDDGEARLMDLSTSLNVLVYDDAKAYFDLNKGMAPLRAAVEHERKAHPRWWKKRAAGNASYRALGETRTVGGHSCAMYERALGGHTDQVCFAPFGGAIGEIGTKDDFAWLDAFMARALADIVGEKTRAALVRTRTEPPGFVLWESSIEDDGSKTVAEVVKLSRDPLPPALFEIPADYKEFSRRLTASEHQPIATPPLDAANVRSPARSSGLHLTGGVMVLLAVVLLFVLFFNALILHLAANIVLDHPRFTQALVAAVINAGAAIAFEVIPLPAPLTLGFGAFGIFAGLKISYGASTGRTIGLFLVAMLITLTMGFLGRAILPGR
jgi:hypothetical protein